MGHRILYIGRYPCHNIKYDNPNISIATWDFSSFIGRVVVIIEMGALTLKLSVFDEGDNYRLKYYYLQNIDFSISDVISTPYGDITAKSNFITISGTSYSRITVTFASNYIEYDVTHGFITWSDLTFTYLLNNQQDYQIGFLGYDGGTYDLDGTATLTTTMARHSSQGGYSEIFAGVLPGVSTFNGKLGVGIAKIWFTNGMLIFNHKLTNVASTPDWYISNAGTSSGFFWFGRTTQGAVQGYKYWVFGDDFYADQINIYIANPPTNGLNKIIDTLGFTMSFTGWSVESTNTGLFYYNHTTNTLYNIGLDNLQTNENYIDNGCVRD